MLVAPDSTPGPNSIPRGDMVTEDPQTVQPPTEQPPKPTRSRMRRRWKVLIGLACVVVVFIIAAFIAAHYTSRSSFCDTCHEMEPYHDSWTDSSHSSAECRDCHIPPGFIPYVEAKLFSLREVWVHMTGRVDAPLAVTPEIPNESCYRCHETPDDMTLGAVPFSHAEHEDEFCIDCHVRFVHTDVNPPYYRSPSTMAACTKCHDGTRAAAECSCATKRLTHLGVNAPTVTTQRLGRGRSSIPSRARGATPASPAQTATSAVQALSRYRGTDLPRPSPECVSCHGDQHGGLTDCADCHDIDAWRPSTFTHPK